MPCTIVLPVRSRGSSGLGSAVRTLAACAGGGGGGASWAGRGGGAALASGWGSAVAVGGGGGGGSSRHDLELVGLRGHLRSHRVHPGDDAREREGRGHQRRAARGEAEPCAHGGRLRVEPEHLAHGIVVGHGAGDRDGSQGRTDPVDASPGAARGSLAHRRLSRRPQCDGAGEGAAGSAVMGETPNAILFTLACLSRSSTWMTRPCGTAASALMTARRSGCDRACVLRQRHDRVVVRDRLAVDEGAAVGRQDDAEDHLHVARALGRLRQIERHGLRYRRSSR